MKLLQQSWSDMLILDHLHQRMHHSLPDEAVLPNGQKFDLVSLCLLGVPTMTDQLNAVTHKLLDLRFDQVDFACLKFLMLLNPGKLQAVREGFFFILSGVGINGALSYNELAS